MSPVTWWDKDVPDAKGDFTRYFQDEFANVVRTAYFILHDRQRSEDVAQEAFTQLFTHWTKVAAYQRPERVGTAHRDQDGRPCCGARVSSRSAREGCRAATEREA